MKEIIIIVILGLMTLIFANDSIPKSNSDFFDDCSGYLVFGERMSTSGSFIRRADCKDNCYRYANLGFEVRLIKFKSFSLHLCAHEETYMAGTRNLFFSAPMFQDYYLDIFAKQKIKFLTLKSEFSHFCSHYIDTLLADDSIESWERLQINCLVETKWEKSIDYPAGNLSAEFGIAKYFPLDDCNWRYGLNYNAQFSISLTKTIHLFVNFNDEIKFAVQSPKQTKPEFRLGIIFQGKLVNLALNSVTPLQDNKSASLEIKIFK